MARLLNSQCDYKNSFFTCDVPEDTILLILKVKTQTGNHQSYKNWKFKIILLTKIFR